MKRIIICHHCEGRGSLGVEHKTLLRVLCTLSTLNKEVKESLSKVPRKPSTLFTVN